MSDCSYQVIFTGTLRSGFSRREGIRHLAQRLGLGFDQIKKLLAAVRPVVKRCEKVSEAERLMGAFWQAGWHTELLCEGQLLFDGEHRSPSIDQHGVDEVEAQTLFSEDGCCAIEVPADWQKFVDLNGSAVIQAGSLQGNQFVVVLSQKLADLPATSTIGAYCGAQLKQCASKLQGSEILTPATPLEEGSFPGYFGEIAADCDAIPVQYLVACLECDERIFTLFLWCEMPEYPRRKQDFDRIVLSFRAESTLTSAERKRIQIARNGKVPTL